MKWKPRGLVCFSSKGPLHGGGLQLREHLRPVVGRPVGKMHVPHRVRGQSRADGVRQRREGLPQRVRTPPARLQGPEEHPGAVPGPLWWVWPFCLNRQQRVDHICGFFPPCSTRAPLPIVVSSQWLSQVSLFINAQLWVFDGEKRTRATIRVSFVPSLREREWDGGKIRVWCRGPPLFSPS